MGQPTTGKTEGSRQNKANKQGTKEPDEALLGKRVLIVLGGCDRSIAGVVSAMGRYWVLLTVDYGHYVVNKAWIAYYSILDEHPAHDQAKQGQAKAQGDKK